MPRLDEDVEHIGKTAAGFLPNAESDLWPSVAAAVPSAYQRGSPALCACKRVTPARITITKHVTRRAKRIIYTSSVDHERVDLENCHPVKTCRGKGWEPTAARRGVEYSTSVVFWTGEWSLNSSRSIPLSRRTRSRASSRRPHRSSIRSCRSSKRRSPCGDVDLTATAGRADVARSLVRRADARLGCRLRHAHCHLQRRPRASTA